MTMTLTVKRLNEFVNAADGDYPLLRQATEPARTFDFGCLLQEPEEE
jgi:hypothetical protein